VVNAVLRMLGKVMGCERVFLLLRYAAFLTRESNYASVMLDRPFAFAHTARRPIQPSVTMIDE
jgi:hypothetical protein